MAEVGVSLAAKLAEYLVDPSVRQLQYMFCVGKITRNVGIRKEELIFKQGRVQERVQEAINRTERIDDEVNYWKSDVESLIAEVENLEEELKANNDGLRGWCPTRRRYRLCKRLAKTTKRMIDLNTKSDCFNVFSHPVIIPDIEYHTSQNFKLFNSTQLAFGQLWECLTDDDSFIIGLWGMGGSGKTTLVKEVGKKAKESQLFDRVVLTTISQSPDIRKIQDEIADTLGIKLEEESEIERAKRIALQLENKEQILIILDDVWAKLNLEHIGILFGGNHKGSCKVVLTTRRLNVGILMECKKMIQLDLLKEDEAWTLFQTHANVSYATGEDVARAIAMECKGLPIAIVAVGTCLKGKGIDEMKEMLYRLRNAKPINVDKGVRNVFRCLELSYDYLATPEAKLLLLMCAMFPEDHNIVVEDLFTYGVGLGLCRNVDSFETARSEVRTTINYLIDSSLLMENSSKSNVHAEKYVKLHDMVRDVALWIACKDHRTIMVNCSQELDELIVDGVINDCYAFSSWYDNNRLLQFPSQFHAPKLEFLLFCSSELLDISHATFEGIEGLKALIIICTNWGHKIELQPQSIQHFSNLRTLRLWNWNLCDISFVASLTRLEILDLQGSEFARVPDGIEKLSKLKLLDLSRCRIDECCYKVIGRCSQLEELYVSKHFSHPRNTNCYENLGGSTANLLKLRRYDLEIGERYSRAFLFQNESRRSLSLGQLNISLTGAVLKDLAQRATSIEFYELEGGSKSFMADMVQAVGGMNELTKLCLQRCLEMEYIIDEITPHQDAIVPRLDELVLRDMLILKQLSRGPSPFSLFQKLKRLNIFNCPQLVNIFPAANCNLGNLKSLTISSCPMLTSLFPNCVACTQFSLMELRIEDAPQLLNIFPTANCNLGSLKSLTISSCPMLTSLFPDCAACTQFSLMELRIEDAPQLLNIFPAANCNLDNLKSLTISSCPMLTFLFPDSAACTLFSLMELRIKDAPQLLNIFPATNCNLCSLKSLTISSCPMLTYLFPVSAACTLLSLMELQIKHAPQMKFVFVENASEEQLMHDQDES